MLQRLAGVALQAAVEPLEALSFEERLGAVVAALAGLAAALLQQQCVVSRSLWAAAAVRRSCSPCAMSTVCESSEQLLRMLVCVEMYKVKACHDTYRTYLRPTPDTRASVS